MVNRYYKNVKFSGRVKKYKFLSCFLMLFIAFSSLSIYAETLSLNKMLNQLARPQLTSLQRSNLIENCKAQRLKGIGRVRDILKSSVSEDEAMIYLAKSFKGKQYEIVLIVSRESAVKIKKGNIIRFEGKFVGMTFETLRFEDAKIIRKPWWSFYL